MSKLIRITLLLIAFTAQSVTAVSMHCAMDMTNMDMGMDMASAQSNTDMHGKMDHSGHTDRGLSELPDCCETLSDCPMGTCTSPALNDAVELDLMLVTAHQMSTDIFQQTKSTYSNLYRPPIIA
ncbi:MAG: hypothetical protein OQJ89_00095 [Kangiellaceae bacterium]|nr:hypothetical protein [Kangiellaceae bacterium]MCW9000533.1 hypothetical protein [Kangiellaceae bacterium]MCW9015338.1 hypothetical protein [Kangiellaceae bacterium]